MRYRAGALTALCLVVSTVVVACGSDGSDAIEPERGEPEQLTRAEYTHHHSEEFEGRVLWEAHAAEDIGERDLMLINYHGDRSGIGPGGLVQLVDVDTREIAGEVTAGGLAFAEYHAESGRLVMAYMRLAPPPDREPGASGGFSPWFWVLSFDVNDGLAPRAEIPVGPDVTLSSADPGRVLERGGLTLSRDGDYAYVVMDSRSEDDETPGVAVVNLEHESETYDFVPHPSRDPATCGRPEAAVYPYGESSVMVTCSAVGIVRIIDPDGSVREDIDINGMGYVYGYPEWGDRIVAVATAVETPSGIGLIQADGTYAVIDDGVITDTGRALPEGTTLLPDWAGGVFRIDDTRVVLPYRTQADAGEPYEPFTSPTASGFVVFDLESETITHNVAVPHRGSYGLPGGAVALVEEGRIDIFDLDSGDVTQSFEALTLEGVMGAERVAEMPPNRALLPRVR